MKLFDKKNIIEYIKKSPFVKGFFLKRGGRLEVAKRYILAIK